LYPSLFRLLLIAAIAVCAAIAQVTTGTILGTVTDSSGAAVAGASVSVVEINKNTTSRTVTDETGTFNVPFLVPGVYSVSVEKPGFKKGVQQNLPLEVDQKARADFQLAVGNVSETVEVTAAAPLVRSESAELGEVIGTRAVRELPLNGRNFAQLVYLNPGVTPGQAGENLSGASTFNPRGPSNFNALGSRANTNAWLVDGIDNNEYTFNTVVVAPSHAVRLERFPWQRLRVPPQSRPRCPQRLCPGQPTQACVPAKPVRRGHRRPGHHSEALQR